MSKPQIQISVNLANQWAIRRPISYRYTPKKYVDQFFEDGILRLSSFSAFSKHTDEERKDASEGSGIVQNVDTEGQFFSTVMSQGHDAYVFCSSTRYDSTLAEAFECDSGFRINDTTSFGCEIARALPHFRGGLEGQCIYMEGKVVKRSAGKFDLETMKISHDSKNIDMGKMFGAISELAGDDLYFLKMKKHEHQAEYRLIWSVSGKPDDFIEVKCPEAIQFCTRFEDI